MATNRHRIPALIAITALVLVAAVSGCDDKPGEAGTPEPWNFHSKKAPYSVNIPGQWVERDTKRVNRYADLALTLGDQFYLIVIPQKLAQFEGIEPQDALDLKRASLGLLKERIDQFKVEREGPVKLGSQDAIAVFAEGVADDKPIQYISTYATRGPWAYQIIAWGPQKQEDGLVAATDALLEGWTFDDAAPSEDAAGPDDSDKPQSDKPNSDKPDEPTKPPAGDPGKASSP